MIRNLLVVGAKHSSIGEAIKNQALSEGFDTVSAGVSGEALELDIRSGASILSALHLAMVRFQEPFHIACTAGINWEGSILDGTPGQIEDSMSVNFIGHMELLRLWYETTMNRYNPVTENLHFVSVASNSAHIPRSNSLPYCASKAALVMGMRCAARKLASENDAFNAWTVSPGWVDMTPMSDEVEERLHGAPAHRIPGGIALTRWEVARQVVTGLRSNRGYNGCDIRIDGGEL